MNSSIALILFAKEPIEAQVKTRLASSLGDKKAKEVYVDFCKEIQDQTLAWAQDFSSNNFLKDPTSFVSIDRLLAWSNPEDPTDNLVPPQLKSIFSFCQFTKQSEGDLGDRLKDILKYALEKKYSKILIRGTDSPDLENSVLDEAIDDLNNNDVVIGPTSDGGYYLIGFNLESNNVTLFSKLFENINWSTAQTFQNTFDNAKENNLTLKVLREWYDIDNVEDYHKYLKLKESK